MKNKKGTSLLFTALIILLALIIILVFILGIYNLFFSKSADVKTVTNAKELMGTNIFVIGLLKSQLNYEGNTITLSELIAYHNLKNDKKYSDMIRTQINSLMNQMFGKNVCWELRSVSWIIKDETKNCIKLSKKESISSTIKIAGFDAQSFDIIFETKT